MTDKTPHTLDRLWDDIPTGHAPVGDLLAAGHAARRRQRRSVLAGTAAVAALLVGGGAVTANVLDGGDRTDIAASNIPPTHTVTVHTILEGPRAHYFEGASTEASLVSDMERRVHEPNDGPFPSPPGWSESWADLPAGRYDLTAAVRPCNGSCESLAPATDSCQKRVDVTTDTELLVTFHYGQPCQVAVVPTGQTVVPSVTGTINALDAKTRLEDAGFAVEINQMICPPTASCVSGVVSTAPAEGSIVRPGSTITINTY